MMQRGVQRHPASAVLACNLAAIASTYRSPMPEAFLLRALIVFSYALVRPESLVAICPL